MLIFLRKQFITYIRANVVSYFFIILIFVIGIALGSLAAKALPGEQKIELINYLNVFFEGLISNDKNLIDTQSAFWSVLLNNVKTLGLIFILGFTIIGMPFILFIILMRGFIIGFTVGFLVNEFVFKGLLFAALAVLPHNFLLVPVFLATAVSAITFSLMLLKQRGNLQKGLLYNASVYSLFFLCSLLVTIVASLIEVYISPSLMKLAVKLFM
ncbi:stage II sporulation protein M [Selenomonadales bacterium OttesenSCG-928-I06]|nr:stage II sporulation protein M [Selenomonadales bacterium OttesenSCG-928-I06]